MDTTNLRGLLIAAGLMLIAVGGQPLVSYISGDSSLHSVVPSTFVVLTGIVMVGFGFFWKPKPIPAEAMSTLRRRFTDWANSPVPYALILLMVWGYFETLAVRRNNEIISLRNDEQSMAKVIDRLVMPRHLTKNQQRVISDFLSQFDPHEYAFQLPSNDEEASSYRADIEQALIKAGWTRSATNPYDYTNDVREGLTIQFTQTLEHAQKGYDPKNPDPSRLLQMALGLAGVPIDGSGSASGVSVTEDRLVIGVGHPRKDSYVLTLPED